MQRMMAALALGACAVSGSASAAYYFEAQTTIEGAGAAGSVRAWVDGPSARVEFVDGAGGPFAAGSYLITSNAGETVFVVDPANRTILEMDLAQMLQTATSAMNVAAGLVRVEFDGFTSEKLAEEPAGRILGYAATRHHLKTGYTMRLSVLGRAQESRHDTEQEIWCTDEIAAEGFAAWLRPDRFRTGHEDIDRLIEQQYAGLDCVPLRTRAVTTTADATGAATTVTTLTEVTVLREEPAAPGGAFDLPADYERTSLSGALGGLLSGGGAGEADGGAGSSSGSERRGPRLRDLIGVGR